jgi:hypothetical protein
MEAIAGAEIFDGNGRSLHTEPTQTKVKDSRILTLKIFESAGI